MKRILSRVLTQAKAGLYGRLFGTEIMFTTTNRK